jgi:hypothetical protein
VAAWHVDFHLVPRRVLTSPSALAAALADTDWWTAGRFPPDYRERLAAVAPAVHPASPELEAWGSEEGDRIEVRSRDGRVRGVTVRVDVRRPDSRFAAALLGFVRAAGAALVRHDGLVVAPSVGAFAGALRTAEAWRFASDPATFLASDAARDGDDE